MPQFLPRFANWIKVHMCKSIFLFHLNVIQLSVIVKSGYFGNEKPHGCFSASLSDILSTVKLDFCSFAVVVIQFNIWLMTTVTIENYKNLVHTNKCSNFPPLLQSQKIRNKSQQECGTRIDFYFKPVWTLKMFRPDYFSIFYDVFQNK